MNNDRNTNSSSFGNNGQSTVDLTQVNIYLAQNGDKFPNDKIPYIRERLSEMSQSEFSAIQFFEYKKPSNMLIAACFDLDRILMEELFLGILKLCFIWTWVWTIIDLFTVYKRTREYNFKRFINIAHY